MRVKHLLVGAIMAEDKYLGEHSFNFDPSIPGGCELRLITKFYDNGDPTNNIYTNQELKLQSYENSASINLFGVQLSPANLRQLANELEQRRNKF
jgi:hypothetical protein